jgi:hypothetical protein
MDVCCAWNCDPRKFMMKFSLTLSSLATLHIQFLQKNLLFNSLSNQINISNQISISNQIKSIILAAVASRTWLWVMQFLPGAGKWQLHSGLSVNALYIYRKNNCILGIIFLLILIKCDFKLGFNCKQPWIRKCKYKLINKNNKSLYNRRIHVE